MSKAKCFRCGASATADTYEQARKELNHSIGLSRGIKCGDSYGRVQEIEKQTTQKTKQSSPTETKIAEPQTEDTNPKSTATSEKVKEKKKSKKDKYL